MNVRPACMNTCIQVFKCKMVQRYVSRSRGLESPEYPPPIVASNALARDLVMCLLTDALREPIKDFLGAGSQAHRCRLLRDFLAILDSLRRGDRGSLVG